MRTLLRPSLVFMALMTLLLGGIYPAVVTGISQVVWPFQANGSLVTDTAGQVRGSALLGQAFSAPGYLWSRPSATAPAYNGAASGGSNLGPTNPALVDGIKDRIAALQASDSTAKAPIPVDLVTASGSGLDPHVSPAAAAWQVSRIARARGLDPAEVQRLIDANTAPRFFGFVGEQRVNVLLVNLALDHLTPSAGLK
ncbi:MAG: potassium-transporting ATPase subunit KdpC [Gemmatimonadales bacterium]